MSYVAELPQEDYTVKVVNSRVKNPRHTLVQVGKETRLAFKNMSGLGPSRTDRLGKIYAEMNEVAEVSEDDLSQEDLERVLGHMKELLEIISTEKAQVDYMMDELPLDVIQEVISKVFQADEQGKG